MTTASTLNRSGRQLIEVFLRLQVLDVLTTLPGFPTIDQAHGIRT
jgi:hypothetical protein